MEMPSNLSVDNIQPFYEQLVLNFDDINELDFSSVDFLDTAGIQLLLTFMLSKQKREQDVTFINVSQEYQDKIKHLGLWEHFNGKVS